MSRCNLVRDALLSLALFCSSLTAAESPAKESPFLPPPGATTVAMPAAPLGYSLSGMTTVGKETLLSITREKDKRSTWIAVGKTSGEVTVLNYDPKKDEAIIEADGKKLTLPMRKAAAVIPATSRPAQNTHITMPASAPVVNPAPAEVKMPPLNQREEKEMEARMLVSDLLEIGQQQRKAYEAAARAAAEEKAKKNQATDRR